MSVCFLFLLPFLFASFATAISASSVTAFGGPHGLALAGCELGVRMTFLPVGLKAEDSGLAAAGRAGKASAPGAGPCLFAGWALAGAAAVGAIGTVAPAQAVFGAPLGRPPVILAAGRAGNRFEVPVLPHPPARPTAERADCEVAVFSLSTRLPPTAPPLADDEPPPGSEG